GLATKRRALQEQVVLIHQGPILCRQEQISDSNANSEISNANCEFRDNASSTLHAKRSSLHMSSIAGFVWSRPWPPRAYWKGYLKLSLVSCPVALFPASSEREKISFNQINKKPAIASDTERWMRRLATRSIHPTSS